MAGVTSNYAYDPIYELTSVMQGANTTESYSYDPVGNRLSSLGLSAYSYNTSNELTSTSSTSYTYDSNGNTISKTDSTGTTNYTWDFENRLSSVTLPGTGGTVTFKYDVFGRRIQKIFVQNSTTTTTNYVYGGEDTVEEADQNGNVLAKYARTMRIDEPLAESRSGTISYYEQDGLDSVTSLTNTVGALANTYTFNSFGKATNSTGSLTNPFRYAGREFDSETNLYYYRTRYYDPGTGRFLSEDPIRYDGGNDFYVYVGNEPQDWIDSDGTQRDRGRTGQPGGTGNPYKHMSPDPDNPNQVIFEDPHTGKSYPKAKPDGFDDYWNKKHPKPQPKKCPDPDKPEPPKQKAPTPPQTQDHIVRVPRRGIGVRLIPTLRHSHFQLFHFRRRYQLDRCPHSLGSRCRDLIHHR